MAYGSNSAPTPRGQRPNSKELSTKLTVVSHIGTASFGQPDTLTSVIPALGDRAFSFLKRLVCRYQNPLGGP